MYISFLYFVYILHILSTSQGPGRPRTHGGAGGWGQQEIAKVAPFGEPKDRNRGRTRKGRVRNDCLELEARNGAECGCLAFPFLCRPSGGHDYKRHTRVRVYIYIYIIYKIYKTYKVYKNYNIYTFYQI